MGPRRVRHLPGASLSTTGQQPALNRLLAALPRAASCRILSACEVVQLAYGEVLYERLQPVTCAYFPTTSFASVLMRVDPESCVEVALVGNEGMLGLPLVLRVDHSPVAAVVQGGGAALRIDAAAFRDALDDSDALRRCLERYLFVQVAQIARAAACIRFHVVEARLARWLLMTQDRAHDATFHVTHEILADRLGVRRVSVTEAAGALQKQRLIAYSRGRVTVLDRRRLEVAACGCYGADRAAYRHVLG